MGFGTLFIGYFFLINISYYFYTDIIAALIMTIGLYRLSFVNKYFRYGGISSLCFAVFALIELIISAIELFIPLPWSAELIPYLGCARYLFIFTVTVFIMRGIENVAHEVEADALARTAKAALPISLVFPVACIFELPLVADLLSSAAAFVYFTILLALVFLIISNLLTIYKAYMQITMPSEDSKRKKKINGGIMNKFYEGIERGNREYAEYKIKKLQTKNSKRKK